MALTIKAIEAAKPTDTVTNLPDGDSLYLQIKPSGTKSWIFRYRLEGKGFKKSFGLYPTVSLADARKKRVKARSDLANDKDPFPKKVHSEVHTKGKTFKDWTEWYIDKVTLDLSDTHINRTLKSLKKDIYPAIGDIPMNDVTAKDVIAIMHSMSERGGIESARKAFSTVTTVFVRGQRCTRFGDPLGDKTTAFPCNSVITGSSPNVFIEASGGAVT